jgi:hypothetical protein
MRQHICRLELRQTSKIMEEGVGIVDILMMEGAANVWVSEEKEKEITCLSLLCSLISVTKSCWLLSCLGS